MWTKLETKACLPCIKAKTKKRTVNIAFTPTPEVSTYGTWWVGGSRYDFFPLCLETGLGITFAFRYPSMPRSPFSGPASVDVPCVPFWAVAQTGVSCGKDAGLVIHLCDYGDSTLRALLLGAIQGQTPWYVVADKYQDLGIDPGALPKTETAEVA